jgi:hypothetical protein
LEELERLAPQRADEIYNEFDFTDPSTPNTDPITLSYGESISGSDPSLDFRPFVDRADKVARSYHKLLQSLGEASAQSFRIQRREWFLASQSFVTIHICFAVRADVETTIAVVLVPTARNGTKKRLRGGIQMYNRPPRMPEILVVFTRNGIGKKWQLLLLKKEIPAKPGASISAELTGRWIS